MIYISKMKIFKNVFRIIWGTQIALCVMTVICALVSNGFCFTLGYIYSYIMLFLQIPVSVVFVIAVLYNCFLKKVPIALFKTEFLYILIFIIVMLLVYLFFDLVPELGSGAKY